MPHAEVAGATGRPSSFEVTVDGKEVYSKLKSGAFPDFGALAKQLVDAAT
jgi:selT/selW/selH-like putative selenoprotein